MTYDITNTSGPQIALHIFFSHKPFNPSLSLQKSRSFSSKTMTPLVCTATGKWLLKKKNAHFVNIYYNFDHYVLTFGTNISKAAEHPPTNSGNPKIGHLPGTAHM